MTMSPKKENPYHYPPHMRIDIIKRNRNIDLNKELCVECNGTGNVFFSSYMRCKECNGRGYNND